MTEYAETVFETFEVRKSKRQRAAFRDFLRNVAAKEGYAYREEKGLFGARNVVIGNTRTARVLYTAHYDTCARMPVPNFITPANFAVYLLYQMLLVAGMFAVAVPGAVLCGGLVRAVGGSGDAMILHVTAGFEVSLLVALWLLMFGPANPHTANDNTSGVTALLDLMVALPPALRGEVAFVFFDLEELVMLGSMGYSAYHPEAENQLVINFDCVSDGDTILFAVRKHAAQYAPMIEAAFPSTERYTVLVRTKGVFYPSDQTQFRLGVGVAALKKTKKGLLYMNRIHTKSDTVYEEENIAYLTAHSVRLAELMAADTDSERPLSR